MVADLAVSRQLELPFFETKWLALLLEDRDLVGLWKAAGRHDFLCKISKNIGSFLDVCIQDLLTRSFTASRIVLIGLYMGLQSLEIACDVMSVTTY